MRLIKTSTYSPITALTTAFNAQTFTSTGAATAPTTTATTDLLAHLVTFTSPVQATLAGITFTIVGTDSDDKAQTETGITGPASNSTVTSTKYFKTITTVQPSATMGGLVVSIGVAAASVSPTVVLDRRSNIAALVDADISGTINYTLQETYDNIFDIAPSAADWGSYSTAFSAKTATVAAQVTVGACAVRFLTNTVTNGATYLMRISQPANPTA